MRILCLGDSLTYGFDMPRRRVWTALAAEQTQTEIINRAINGNTTGGMLASFSQEVENTHPEVVFLMGGGNDLIYGGDIAGARANMGAMVHLACHQGLAVIIGIPIAICPPVRADWAALFQMEEVARQGTQYADWLRGMGRAFRLPVVDFERAFPLQAQHQGRPLKDYYLEDGLHPNQLGHEVMAGIASTAILKLKQRISPHTGGGKKEVLPQ